MLSTPESLTILMQDLITRRYEIRGGRKIFSESDKKKLRSIVDLILAGHRDAVSVVKAFLDHVMPVAKSYRPVRSLFFEFKNFEAETLPAVEKLFPITESDEEVFRVFLADWNALGKEPGRLHDVYFNPINVRPISADKTYRYGTAFYRVLETLRVFQTRERANYPLFTLRSFVAAQVEMLSSFVDRMVVGHLDSEKAFTRYEEWYRWRFYSAELVKKAKARPAATNPVSEMPTRLEFEIERFNEGSRIGEFIFAGEQPIVWGNQPELYTRKDVPKPREEQRTSTVTLPPGMTGLLR